MDAGDGAVAVETGPGDGSDLDSPVLVDTSDASDAGDAGDGASDAGDAGDAADVVVLPMPDGGDGGAADWAGWRMPNSPIDVTNGAPNPESYTDNGDGTVTDRVTGLMWEKAVPSGTYTWGDAATAGTAQNYCAGLTLAGHSDWRLPSKIELVSIVDTSTSNPAIETTYFPSTPIGFYWASTQSHGNQGGSWSVDFYFGYSLIADATTADHVRCVR
jgi:hypothetical protein